MEIKPTRFGRVARYYIENFDNKVSLQVFNELENVSVPLENACKKVAEFYRAGYISLSLSEISIMTKQVATEVLVKAEEKYQEDQRRSIMQTNTPKEIDYSAEFLALRRGSKVILTGTKITGVKGENKANSVAVREFEQYAQKMGLKVETVKKEDRTVLQYEVEDPSKKLNEKALYANIASNMELYDARNKAVTELYEARTNGKSEDVLNALSINVARTKIAWLGYDNITDYEAWTNKQIETNKNDPRKANTYAKSFEDYANELTQLEQLGYVNIKEQPVNGAVKVFAGVVDKEHRTALSKFADKDVEFLKETHRQILERKNTPTSTDDTDQKEVQGQDNQNADKSTSTRRVSFKR